MSTSKHPVAWHWPNKFVAWLAKQSELSLARSQENNSPTIARRELDEFVRG